MHQRHVQELREYGFVVLRGVLDADEIRAYAGAWGVVRRRISDEESSLKRSGRFIMGPLEGLLASLHRDGRLVSIMRLIYGSDIALYHSRMLVKDEEWSGPVEVHQDQPYFHGGQMKTSFFVPLCSVHEDSGGLIFVSGSHRYGNVGIRGTIQLDKFPSLQAEQPELEPGDLVIMNFLTWHHSKAASNEGERPVLQITFQPATDGSYDSRFLSTPELICGQWRTEYFLPYGFGIEPDRILPEREAQPSPGIEKQPRSRLRRLFGARPGTSG